MVDCGLHIEYFDELLGRLSKQGMADNRRLAMVGTLELTPYCNMKCQHCYVTQSKLEGRLLSTGEWYRIIDEITEEGCLWLLLTGGEPLLRPDFLDIYTYAKKKGLLISLFTNATMITAEIAAYFREFPPYQLEISVYGASEETYEKVTGIPGSFSMFTRGMELLKQNDIPFDLKTVLLTTNKHEYSQMKEMAQVQGLKFRMDPMINPALDGSRTPCQYRLSPEEIVEIESNDIEIRHSMEEWIKKSLEKPAPSLPDTVFTCGSGWGKFHIDGFGFLQMCTIARQPGYDLRKGSFSEGWHGFLSNERAKKLSEPSECRTCQYRSICSICPGWSFLEDGTLEEHPIPFLCDVCRLRVEKFRKTKAVTGT